MVHRAVLGPYGRFMVLLLEQFKEVIPVWLSPIQVNIVPVNMKYYDEYYNRLFNTLNDEDIRVNYDAAKESMSKKTRQISIMKNPYTIIIDDNKRDNNLVSFIKYIKEEIKKDKKAI